MQSLTTLLSVKSDALRNDFSPTHTRRFLLHPPGEECLDAFLDGVASDWSDLTKSEAEQFCEAAVDAWEAAASSASLSSQGLLDVLKYPALAEASSFRASKWKGGAFAWRGALRGWASEDF